MKYGPLILIMAIIMGIYVLPSVSARFAGTHTIEYNATAGVSSVKCHVCHQAFYFELSAGNDAGNTTQVHKNAAGNKSYTQGWLNMSIVNTTEYGVCHLCHRPQVDVNLSHSQGIVRVCTDLDCHGSNESTNNTAYSDAGNVGPVLGGDNVHSPWFDGMSNFDARYKNETADSYTLDYYACLGCHTNIIVTRNTTRIPFPHTNATALKDRYI